MTRQQSLVFLASVFGLLGTNAWAAEPLPQFAGPYVGAAIGFASKKVEVDNLTLGSNFSDQENATSAGISAITGSAAFPARHRTDINTWADADGARRVRPTGLNGTTA
jgi:hypothetical protein